VTCDLQVRCPTNIETHFCDTTIKSVHFKSKLTSSLEKNGLSATCINTHQLAYFMPSLQYMSTNNNSNNNKTIQIFFSPKQHNVSNSLYYCKAVNTVLFSGLAMTTVKSQPRVNDIT